MLALAACNEAPDARDFTSQVDGKIFTDSMMVGRVGIVTDKATGCEYIATGYSEPSLTPRLDHMGQPICSGPADNQIGGAR